ncbi:NDMA-dependent alcohol dehydrogenase [Microbacterium thalassium]|uniref:S-(Hydroxymethyl)glutathione dehydrogenase/alcohol dehydrogenase n=1 Tax=Microbacterium thalassium TaxID=362649 RepID=A0A7X0FNC1_9MICO|nr:NDMA-dependent alcohol dehydrogenase [Microbacterium thalassium]MBB6390688.1 S-(hydroxymethyl)glutathione dehydrogenase/alcohol dehydrogenase [Microbacterium thalassium]
MKTRAAVLWTSPGTWEVREVDLDDPGPTEVLVQMVATGMCHSDDHIATGDLPFEHPPVVAGHEGAGVVRQVGSAVTDLAVGDHVLTSFVPSCGRCKWCARGQQNLCDAGGNAMIGEQPSGGYRMRADGVEIATMTGLGGFSEWQVFDETSLIKIDPSLPLHSVCLVACAVQTGVGSATSAADVRPGDVVIVMGVGGIGMNAVQGASLAGASHVIAVDPAPRKLEWAPQFGATEVFADMPAAQEFAASITNGQGADSAIVTTGVVTNEHIGQAFEAIRKGGTVVVTGLGPADDDGPIPGFNASNAALMQKRIQGALFGMGSPRDAMPTILELYTAGRIKIDELVTKRYTLDQINDAYADMHAGELIRGVIDFVPIGESID